MADKTPVRATFSGADPDGLAEYQAGETIPVANGGTGAISASAARTSLGLVISTDVAAPGDTVQAGTLFDRISYVSSAIDAHKIIPFFLDEPAHVSPSFNWKRLIRQTSWYAELGAPPTHGAFVIDASQNAINWIDLDSATLAVYMTFTANTAATYMLRAASGIADIKVLDFKLYVANGATWGINIIDFLADIQDQYNAGHARFEGDISDRNGSGGAAVGPSNGLAIVNGTVFAVAVCRDPSGSTDHFGRPLHYWGAATDGGTHPTSIYNPITDAIYDIGSGYGLDPIGAVLTPAGMYVSTSNTVSGGLSDYVWVKRSVEGVTADGVAIDMAIHTSSSMPFSGAANIQCIAALDGASVTDGYPIILAGYDEGLCLIHLNSTTAQGVIWLTSTFATPLLDKQNTVAAYPLDSVTDRSGNGHTLTNIGTTAFSGTSPLGVACANLDGSDDILRLTGTSAFGESVNLSFYIKTASATNPAGSADFPISMTDSAGTAGLIHMYVDTDGSFDARWSDDGGSTYDTCDSSPSDFCDANWHHVYMGQDSTGVYWQLWIDGVLVTQTAISNAAGTFSLDELRIGADQSNGNLFAGQVAQLSTGTTAWTPDEIRLEHSRMVAGLAGNTTLLTADDIDSVQVAPDGEYAIVTAGDVAHIMDPRTGIILSTDAIGAGTLNDAAIWQKDGVYTPSYLLGASTTVEAVQPDELIGG